jgi:hypothetical protein
MAGMPSTGGSSDIGATSLTPAVVNSLPGPVRDVIVSSYNEALLPILLYIVPLVLVGLVLVAFVREKQLSTTIENEDAETEAATHGEVIA